MKKETNQKTENRLDLNRLSLTSSSQYLKQFGALEFLNAYQTQKDNKSRTKTDKLLWESNEDLLKKKIVQLQKENATLKWHSIEAKKETLGKIEEALKMKVYKLETSLIEKDKAYVNLANSLNTTKAQELSIENEILIKEVERLDKLQKTAVKQPTVNIKPLKKKETSLADHKECDEIIQTLRTNVLKLNKEKNDLFLEIRKYKLEINTLVSKLEMQSIKSKHKENCNDSNVLKSAIENLTKENLFLKSCLDRKHTPSFDERPRSVNVKPFKNSHNQNKLTPKEIKERDLEAYHESKNLDHTLLSDKQVRRNVTEEEELHMSRMNIYEAKSPINRSMKHGDNKTINEKR